MIRVAGEPIRLLGVVTVVSEPRHRSSRCVLRFGGDGAGAVRILAFDYVQVCVRRMNYQAARASAHLTRDTVLQPCETEQVARNLVAIVMAPVEGGQVD